MMIVVYHESLLQVGKMKPSSNADASENQSGENESETQGKYELYFNCLF